MTTPFSLSGKTALVTGSSRGIGHAIGMACGAAGAEVIFHGKERVPSTIPEDSGYVQADLFDPDAPRQLIEQTIVLKPNLSLLICNAGIACDGPFMEITSAQWQRTMDLNVRSTYFVAQEFSRAVTSQGRTGAIVITASTNGFQPESGCTVYDTSKGALVMMIRALALDLAPVKIRVNGIAPGLIRTPLTTPFFDIYPERAKHYEKKILLERLGEVEDCTGAVVFLLSEASAYITGQIIVIDGGLTVGQVGRL